MGDTDPVRTATNQRGGELEGSRLEGVFVRCVYEEQLSGEHLRACVFT